MDEHHAKWLGNTSPASMFFVRHRVASAIVAALILAGSMSLADMPWAALLLIAALFGLAIYALLRVKAKVHEVG